MYFPTGTLMNRTETDLKGNQMIFEYNEQGALIHQWYKAFNSDHAVGVDH